MKITKINEYYQYETIIETHLVLKYKNYKGEFIKIQNSNKQLYTC